MPSSRFLCLPMLGACNTWRLQVGAVLLREVSQLTAVSLRQPQATLLTSNVTAFCLPVISPTSSYDSCIDALG